MTEIIYNKDDSQYLDLRFYFKTKFTPGDKKHLEVVLRHYLEEKGILLEDESHKIIIC